MKRYLLFAWWAHEASGGWDDLQGDYDTMAEAEVARDGLEAGREWWWNIVDAQTMQIVADHYNESIPRFPVDYRRGNETGVPARAEGVGMATRPANEHGYIQRTASGGISVSFCEGEEDGLKPLVEAYARWMVEGSADPGRPEPQ